MRRAKYSDGFLLCFFLNLLFSFWLGLIALALWALHLWLGVPLFLTWIALGAWVGAALIATAVLSLAANGSGPARPEPKNVNPYSAKTSDFLPPRADSAPAAQVGGLAAVSECLCEVAALMHMEEMSIAILSRDTACAKVAESLSLCAEGQGLPPVPGEFPEGGTGCEAARHIAGQIAAWRVFLIRDDAGGCYMGVVSHEDALALVSCIRGRFAAGKHTYSVELLDAKPGGHPPAKGENDIVGFRY